MAAPSKMNNFRKKLVSTIVEECEDRNVPISKDFVSFFLNLCELNPEFRIDENDEEVTSRTIAQVTDKILDESSSSVVTLKIQLHFAKHYLNRFETIKKHRHRLQKKASPLLTEICAMTRVKTDRDIEKLYQKILVAVVGMSGLGNPMIPSILREAAMALQSIYLPSEVSHFVSLPKKGKDKQLVELMNIVAGIRLFNKDCQKGGEGIDDLPTILHETIKKSRESILELLEDLMSNIYRLTAILDKFLAVSTIPFVEKSSKDHDNVTCTIETLTACRQQEIYIRKLLNDVEMSEMEFKSLESLLRSRLLKIHDTVKYRTAIPIIQVYPQFIDLAEIWMKLQDEITVLSQINNFLWQLRALSLKDVHDDSRLKRHINDAEILSDAERLERSMGQQIDQCGDCLIIYPNSTKDFEQIHLEFLGFCAWTFVHGRGVLIPGNPNNGVAKWRNKYFAFSSSSAATQFGNDPSRFFYEALDFIRQHPEYIHLFHVHEDVESMNRQEECLEDESRSQVHHDQGMQTDLHILQSNIDPDYHHSLWEHRKRALKLVSLTNCRTRSCQTSLSHFKRSVNVQVAVPVSTHVQTQQAKGTNTKSEKLFIFGLRGCKDGSAPHLIKFSEDQ